ncbi:hypothetical protein FRB94_004037 [Tulasnella sp. JGI-2019a]|nr:hypothetical protein FRB94_004037 [Tulasnella sp. JGI-2019a]
MDTFGRSVSQTSVLKFRPVLPDFFTDVAAPTLQTSTLHNHPRDSTSEPALEPPAPLSFDDAGTPNLAERSGVVGEVKEDDEADDAGIIPPKRLFPVSCPSAELLHKTSFSTLGWNAMARSESMKGPQNSSARASNSPPGHASKTGSQTDNWESNLDSDFDISLGEIADDELLTAHEVGRSTGELRFRRRAIVSTISTRMDPVSPTERTLIPDVDNCDRLGGTTASSTGLHTRNPPPVYSTESDAESEKSDETDRPDTTHWDRISTRRDGGSRVKEIAKNSPFGSRLRVSILRSLSAPAAEGSSHLVSRFGTVESSTIPFTGLVNEMARRPLDVNGPTRRSLLPRTPYPIARHPRRPINDPLAIPLRAESPSSDVTETPERFRRPRNPSLQYSPPLPVSMRPWPTRVSTVGHHVNAFDQLRGTLGDLLSCWCERFTTNALGIQESLRPGAVADRTKLQSGQADWRNQLITCTMIIFVIQLLMLMTIASIGKDVVVDRFLRVLTHRSNRWDSHPLADRKMKRKR